MSAKHRSVTPSAHVIEGSPVRANANRAVAVAGIEFEGCVASQELGLWCATVS
jgi:hypothetical protein